ncbi:ABC transporter permease [Ectobacillus antri]|jgi:ABC-2 type transport system permease protein|uniref:ABC transporter permease n=1 Tax=Ectobacillus antri TaxID=2486280 RepID=A0ABT6H6T6_9BACI|nr:ABC transporter permease [Ectobacillus antri]MDG4656984.1 ABC transporter permease [Ectobacillus antri]MDG5754086.1 ABC transporter permease [Ectobacillus antri]
MHKIWRLTNVLLKMSYAEWFASKKKVALYLFSYVMLLGVGFIFFGTMSYGVYGVFAQYGQQKALLGIGLAVASIWVFLTSVTSVLTVFYYEDDIENLLPLPLQPSQIVTAKFLTVLLTQYVLSSFFVIPILVIYGVLSGAGIVYYLYSVVIYATFPIIPLVLISLLLMVLMRFTNLSKNKDRGRLIVGLFSILFVVGINVFMQWNNRSASQEQVENLLTGGSGEILVSMTTYFPTTYFAATGLSQYNTAMGLLYVLIFIVISMMAFILFYVTAQTYYLKGVIGLSGGVAKRKKVGTAAYEKQVKQTSKWLTYVKKELRMLMRTPAFFLNCVIQGLTTPIIFFFAFFQQNGSIEWMKRIVTNPDQAGLALGVAFCAGMFLLSSNMTATTSFSRDGSSWFVNRYLPIAPQTILFAKIFASWLVSVSILALFGIVMVALVKVSLLFVTLWFVLCLNGLWLTNMIGVRWDAKTADVHWENEQKLFKGRYTLLWNLLVNFLIAAATVGIVLVLYFILHAGIWMTFFVLLFVYGIVNVIIVRALQVDAENILDNVQ